MSEKQFNQLLAAIERFADKAEEMAEAIQQMASVLHKQVMLLERVEQNTNPGTKRLTK